MGILFFGKFLFKSFFKEILFIKFLVKGFTKYPKTIPVKKVTGSMTKAACGLEAINKKAASPIVAIKAANTEPKDTTPLVYKLITIIAPPQPGITPKKALVGIS